DAAVVAGLVARERILLLEQDEAGAGATAKQRERRRQPDDTPADDAEVVAHDGSAASGGRSAGLLGALPYGRERAPRRDGLGIGYAVQDRRQPGLARPLEGGGEILRPLDTLAISAEGPRIGGEVGIRQAGHHDAAGIF